MKKIVFGLIVLGFANLCYSQNINSEIEILEVANAYSKNVAYIDIVQEENMSKFVMSLEDRVSKYDVTTSSKFNGRKKPFKVIFKSTYGLITATYNAEGIILTTNEKFKNIKLPIPLVKIIYKEYPNWSFLSDSYTVAYQHNKNVKKTYRVKIGNGKMTKNIKINLEGNSDSKILLLTSN